MLGEILDDLLISKATGPCIVVSRHIPSRLPTYAPCPSTLDPRLVEALRARGMAQLYSHQARSWELVEKGHHVVVVTPTASGKTLCYNIPALQALLTQPDARVLYLFPTKALAQDQLAELQEIAKTLPDLRMFTYDGDTPQDARRAVRARANLVLTNPDMLHSGILPHHTKWATLFQNLRYVVIDELHAYRGVFGSHLANVLRRLRRICRHYGSAPQFVMASATIGNPRELAERLTGESGRRDRRERRPLRGENDPLLQPPRRQSGAGDPRAVPRRGLEAGPAVSPREDPHHRVRPEPAGHRGSPDVHQGGPGRPHGGLRPRARLPRRLLADAPPRRRAGTAVR